MNDLNNKLPNLARQHTTLETLIPVVRKRVEALKVIQSHCDELELKFVEEIVALEEIYQKLYKSLYTKRYELVNGIVEPEGVKSENALEHEEGDQEKGVPEFWLTAMKTNEILAKKINKRDDEALKYLEDIKCRDFDISKSFKLYFFFGTNPFFKNLVLKKTYDMHHVGEEGNLATAIGLTIRDKIIPHAVCWFTGEAAQGDE
ncbi:Nucleosome assembly protein 14 [Heracleum sosnowskyi]|uniref:Nucleosome assembly protein 14 n=1 Tax=Heracleum sosnowskyi TaxID=360622 RepID=A0AAD8JJY3_9APIA|nr:Nucleosome assembly protein 14 [Heracleum sosnowskyi]